MAGSSRQFRVWFAATCLWYVIGALLPPVLLAQIGAEPDSEVEECLAAAKVVRKLATLQGITKPEKLELECRGERRAAVYKTYESFRRGVTRFGDGSWEMNFSDSFRYERAAYLLDREIGLNMVPVAVLRRIGRREGVLVDWIGEGYHEGDPQRPVSLQTIGALAPQKAAMHLFDALIFNIDRNASNWMVDNDGRLYLIDHSRSFRTSPGLPEDFADQRIWLTREMYRRLIDLDLERLVVLLGGLLDRAQIEAVISRRDRLVQVIDAARSRLGDDVVFRD